jgi:transposase InsO family protein
VKYAWIEAQGDQYPVARMCGVLRVSRTGYLQWRVREPSARQRSNDKLGAQLRVIHAENERSYGRIRLWKALVQQGQRVGQERVRRLMKLNGLRSVYRRPYRVTTDSDHTRPVADNLLDRCFHQSAVDRAWVADITYVPTGEGWLYLAAVLDLASRRIVGWSMSERMPAKLVCDALAMAYFRRKPAPGGIAHSDRGVQYASHAYRAQLAQYQMVQSMSRKANCWDNAPMESFFKTLKVERVHRCRYQTRDEARADLVNWIEGFYNSRRMHSALGYKSPVQFERELRAA